MTKPEVTVATINWNGIKFIKEFFDSVKDQNFPLEKTEVLMIDNGSTDGSRELVREKYPFVKIIELEKNYGFAEACNIAFRSSSSDLFLISGNDTIMPPTFVSDMISEIKRLKIAVIVSNDYPIGSDLSSFRPRDTVNIICGNAVGSINEFNSTAIPRGTFIVNKKQIAGDLFDGDYFAYGEDAWLGFKLLLQGKEVAYSNKCRLWHYGAATGSKLPTLNFYTERNRLLNIFTFFKLKTIIKIFPLLIIDFFLKFLSFTFMLNFKRLSNFLKAHAWMFLNVRKIMKKRIALQAERRFDDEKIISIMSYKLYGYQRGGKKIFFNLIDKFMEIYCRLVGLRVYELNAEK